MKYVNRDSLPVPIQSRETGLEKPTNQRAIAKLQRLATWHTSEEGRAFANKLTLADIVGKGGNLRTSVNQAGEKPVLTFITSQFEYLTQTYKGIPADKIIDLPECESLAALVLNEFGTVLKPTDFVLFTQTFRAGFIRTPNGKTFKYPELYGKLTQREIAEGLHVYSKAKSEAAKEAREELQRIADQYESQVSKLSDKNREKLKAWAEQNHQHALLAKIRLYERYLSGDLQRSREESKALPRPEQPQPKYAGQRLAESLAINREEYKNRKESSA